MAITDLFIMLALQIFHTAQQAMSSRKELKQKEGGWPILILCRFLFVSFFVPNLLAPRASNFFFPFEHPNDSMHVRVC